MDSLNLVKKAACSRISSGHDEVCAWGVEVSSMLQYGNIFSAHSYGHDLFFVVCEFAGSFSFRVICSQLNKSLSTHRCVGSKAGCTDLFGPEAGGADGSSFAPPSSACDLTAAEAPFRLGSVCASHTDESSARLRSSMFNVLRCSVHME